VTNTVVSEEGLSGAVPDSVGSADTTNSATDNSGTVTASDGDGDTLSYRFASKPADGAFTSNNVDINWTFSNGDTVLTGSAGGATILVLTMTAATGAWSADLQGPIDHLDDSLEDDLTIGLTVVASDGVNDSLPANISVTIEDDSPEFNGAQHLILANTIGNIAEGAFDFSFGADGAQSANGITFDLSALQAQNLVTFPEGLEIQYDTSVENQVRAYFDDGTEHDIFQLRLDPDTKTYDFEIFGPQLIATPEEVLAGQGSSFGSGPSTGYIIPDSTDPSADLVLISGYIDGTAAFNTTTNFNTIKASLDQAEVNLNSNAYGVSNPLVNSTELLLLDFGADNFSVAPANTFDGPQVNSVTIQADKGGSEITWVAYADDGSVLSSQTLTTVKNAPIVIEDDEGGAISYVAIYGGVGANTGIVVTSVGAFTNTGTAELEFGITGTDADGDSVSGTITVTVEGDGTLDGSVDSDVLAGGSGDQILTGDDGADIFVWNAGDEGTLATPAVDTIADFDPAEGDVLNLADLLVGEHDGSGVDAGNLDQFLGFSWDGANTTVEIASDALNSPDVTQKVVLEGIDLTAGNTLTDQQIIDSLILGNNLQTDQ
jgi:hypothetical protein